MNHFSRAVSILIILIALSSCTNDTEKYAAINGKWQAAAWLVRGQPSGKNLRNVSFQFNADKTYQSQLGEQRGNGNYKIKGDYLYTQAENQLEIMVRIGKLTNDSLVLNMNNAGQDETLILIKGK